MHDMMGVFGWVHVLYGPSKPTVWRKVLSFWDEDIMWKSLELAWSSRKGGTIVYFNALMLNGQLASYKCIFIFFNQLHDGKLRNTILEALNTHFFSLHPNLFVPQLRRDF